jgi:hypothetical protein
MHPYATVEILFRDPLPDTDPIFLEWPLMVPLPDPGDKFGISLRNKVGVTSEMTVCVDEVQTGVSADQAAGITYLRAVIWVRPLVDCSATTREGDAHG